jgi:predicted dienelactone hydrolase
MVSTVPIHPTGLSHEDTRRTLIQLARSSGFAGRIAAASHSLGDTEVMLGAGADLVLEPFQDAADRAVELLCGAAGEERTEFPEIAAEGREAG